MKRRDLLKVGMVGMGALLLPRGLLAQMRPRLNEDHFLLQIILEAGADFTYLFDARPLAMTAAGLIQNYIGEDPIVYTGANGGACLRTKLTDPLLPHRSRFSVVNGVMMAPTFEGHEQNMNLFFTGNPFGGDSFIPLLNWESASAAPLDGIQNGYTFADLRNHGRVVPLQAAAADSLTGMLNGLPVLRPSDSLAAHIRTRMQANGSGPGRFSAGSRRMMTSFDGMEGLHDKMNRLLPATPGGDEETQFVDFLSQLFKHNVTRSAVWVTNENFDTHDSNSAKAQPAVFAAVAARLAKVFELLASTPFDSKRSMFDVTTVMVTSEFGRTMRIEGNAIGETGTNHNPFSNTVLLAGKGIRGGQVIGASDFASAGETLSGAHLQKDPRRICLMARPFDFALGRPRVDLPAAFDVEDYLNIGSVVNTIFEMFHVDRVHSRINSRGGRPAPVLTQLLA